MRWTCEPCGGSRSWPLTDGRRKCRRCRVPTTPRSVWEGCRLSERTKRKRLDDFLLGVPVYRLRFKRLGNRKTIERCCLLARATLALQEGCREPCDGSVECDDTPLGGRRKGKRGWGAAGKILGLGLLQRNGRVQGFPVPTRRKRVVLPLVRRHTQPGSLSFTEDGHADASLTIRGEQVVVRKEKGRPVGRAPLNGIEGFWSDAKHGLYHYRGIHRKFFPLDLGEISCRFNERDTDLFPKVLQLLHVTSIQEME